MASAFVLFPRLDVQPACDSETVFSGDVASFIRSGYVDHGGRRLPLFPEGANANHYPPLPVYAGVIAARATSSPSSFRIAAATIALVNVLLLYVVAKQVFGRVTLAAVSAAFLLFTPAHVILGRSFRPDGVWHVPFVCAWLLSIAVMMRHRERAGRLLALATGSIAASIYSQPSAGLMAVVLIALTIVALYHCPLTWRDLGAGIAVGAAVALPLLVWLLRDPSAYADTFGQWFVHQAHLRSPRAWWMAASHPNLLTRFSAGMGLFQPDAFVDERNGARLGRGLPAARRRVRRHRCLRWTCGFHRCSRQPSIHEASARRRCLSAARGGLVHEGNRDGSVVGGRASRRAPGRERRGVALEVPFRACRVHRSGCRTRRSVRGLAGRNRRCPSTARRSLCDPALTARGESHDGIRRASIAAPPHRANSARQGPPRWRRCSSIKSL